MDMDVPYFAHHIKRFYKMAVILDWLGRHILRIRYSKLTKAIRFGGTLLSVVVLGLQVTIALRIWMRLLEWQQTAETHAWSDVSSDGDSDLWTYWFHQFKRSREAAFTGGRGAKTQGAN